MGLSCKYLSALGMRLSSLDRMFVLAQIYSLSKQVKQQEWNMIKRIGSLMLISLCIILGMRLSSLVRMFVLVQIYSLSKQVKQQEWNMIKRGGSLMYISVCIRNGLLMDLSNFQISNCLKIWFSDCKFTTPSVWNSTFI